MDKIRNLIIVLISFCFVTSLVAKEKKGTLWGNVTDSRGEALCDVVVAAQNQAKWVLTDSKGEFILDLLPGENELTFSRFGLQPHKVRFRISEGEKQELNVELQYLDLTLEEIFITAKRKSRAANLKLSDQPAGY